VNIIEEINLILEKWEDLQYSVRGIPSRPLKTDEKISEIVNCYTTMRRDEQKKINKNTTVDMAWLLYCFGIRMATYSLRLSDQKYFTDGLSAIAMGLGVLDTRDIWVILPLFCDAQKKNDLSFDEILERDDEFASELKDFLNRDDEYKTLKCMGYVLGIGENGLLEYQRTW